MGIPEAIAHSISKCDPAAQPWLYKNIVLTGGNACFPNFKQVSSLSIRTTHFFNVKAILDNQRAIFRRKPFFFVEAYFSLISKLSH